MYIGNNLGTVMCMSQESCLFSSPLRDVETPTRHQLDMLGNGAFMFQVK